MKTTLKWLIVFAILCAGFTNGFSQSKIEVSGLIDIVGQGSDDILYLNHTFVSDSNFDPLRARLFIEGGNGRTQIFIQTLFSQESVKPFRLYGAYLLHRALEQRDIYLEVGLIPIHDGIWAPNTYSDKNPLVGIPLAHYWKTTVHSYQMPVDIDQVVSEKGNGQLGISYSDINGIRGKAWHSAPVLYDNCWNYGAFSLGTFGRFEYAAGITVGAPADPVQSTDSNQSLAVLARVGSAVTPGLRFHLSGATGAYLADDVTPYLPAGATVNDYMQNLFIVSGQWQWRHFDFMGEFFWNQYETPVYADGLHNTSLYVQGAWKFYPGWYFAARYDEMRFEEVTTSSGTETWDQNVHRVESGIGYHVSRELLTKLVVQTTDVGGGFTSDKTVLAAQLSFAF
jgi:hypothetical protein